MWRFLEGLTGSPFSQGPHDILEGRRGARVSRSGSECRALWASLSCAAPVAGSDKLRPTQNSRQHFRRCSGRQLRRPFQGRGRGITALADSSYHSPFPMCLGSHRFPLLESPHSSCKSNPWLSSKPRPERPPLSQVLGIHFLI